MWPPRLKVYVRTGRGKAVEIRDYKPKGNKNTLFTLGVDDYRVK